MLELENPLDNDLLATGFPHLCRWYRNLGPQSAIRVIAQPLVDLRLDNSPESVDKFRDYFIFGLCKVNKFLARSWRSSMAHSHVIDMIVLLVWIPHLESRKEEGRFPALGLFASCAVFGGSKWWWIWSLPVQVLPRRIWLPLQWRTRSIRVNLRLKLINKNGRIAQYASR
jgi:hypothetical protein